MTAPESIYITSGDARIYCECYGDKQKPALLLLHGNGEDLHYFDSQILYFSPFYYIVAIDCRARGKSSRGTAPLNFFTMAQDVWIVMDTLQIDTFHVLGFSDGANLSLYLALAAQERIASMVLVGANYSPDGFELFDYWAVRFTYYWLTFISLFSSKAYKKKEVWNLMVHHPQLTLAEITCISVPALIITGENDMVSQQQNDEIHQAIKGSKRVTISQADHYVSANKPEILNAIVDNFLKSTTK